MCVWIYMYTHTRVCHSGGPVVYIHTFMYIYVYMYTHTHTRTHTNRHTRTHRHTQTHTCTHTQSHTGHQMKPSGPLVSQESSVT
jgi:hypothetical protein